jgi:hypothetical protein
MPGPGRSSSSIPTNQDSPQSTFDLILRQGGRPLECPLVAGSGRPKVRGLVPALHCKPGARGTAGGPRGLASWGRNGYKGVSGRGRMWTRMRPQESAGPSPGSYAPSRRMPRHDRLRFSHPEEEVGLYCRRVTGSFPRPISPPRGDQDGGSSASILLDDGGRITARGESQSWRWDTTFER